MGTGDQRAYPSFQERRICVLGISTVDAIARNVDDYPPRGGLRTFDSLDLTTGGCAVNCGIALGRMGLACEVITKGGRDGLGELVQSELAAHGVGTRGLVVSDDSHTPFTFVCVHEDGQRSFLHTTGTNGTLCAEEVELDLVLGADLLMVGGAMLMAALDGPPTAELLSRARESGAITVLDTTYVDTAGPDQWRRVLEPVLPHLSWFVPSRPEARAFTGLDQPAAAAEAICAAGCEGAVIKLDREGVYYRCADGTAGTVPALEVESVVDTTGAGDCWCAGFLAGLAQGRALVDALELGNAVAALGIQRAGATDGIPTLEEVDRFRVRNRCG